MDNTPEIKSMTFLNDVLVDASMSEQNSWRRVWGRRDTYAHSAHDGVETFLFYNKNDRRYWIGINDGEEKHVHARFYASGVIEECGAMKSLFEQNGKVLARAEGLPKRWAHDIGNFFESLPHYTAPRTTKKSA